MTEPDTNADLLRIPLPGGSEFIALDAHDGLEKMFGSVYLPEDAELVEAEEAIVGIWQGHNLAGGLEFPQREHCSMAETLQEDPLWVVHDALEHARWKLFFSSRISGIISPMDARRIPDVDQNQVKLLVLQGIPLRELARRLNISHNTILSWAHRGHWQIRAINSGQAAIAQQSTDNAARVCTDYVRENGEKSRASFSNVIRKAAEYSERLDEARLFEHHPAVEGLIRAGDRLHGWSREDHARAFSVVNVALIKTSPEELRIAFAKQAQQLLNRHDCVTWKSG